MKDKDPKDLTLVQRETAVRRVKLIPERGIKYSPIALTLLFVVSGLLFVGALAVIAYFRNDIRINNVLQIISTFPLLILVFGLVYLFQEGWDNELMLDACSVFRDVVNGNNKYKNRQVQCWTKKIWTRPNRRNIRRSYTLLIISIQYRRLNNVSIYSKAKYFLRGIRVKKEIVFIQKRLFRKVSAEKIRRWLDSLSDVADEIEGKRA